MHEKLHSMRQLSAQPINEFFSQMQAIWVQLAISEPTSVNAKEAEKCFEFHGNLRVLHFLMVLTPEHATACASILHQGSLPSLESAVHELLSQETRLSILKSQSVRSNMDTNVVLEIASNSLKSRKTYNYCRKPRHVI